MESRWMGLTAKWTNRRVIGMRGARGPILKKLLRRSPSNAQVLPTLREALALWEGWTVRAAFVVSYESRDGTTPLFRDAFGLFEDIVLYSLKWVSPDPHWPFDRVRGMDSFGDSQWRMRRSLVR